MILINKIIQEALKFDPAAMNLVIQGIKPCSFLTFKFKLDISSISHKKLHHPSNKNVVFFVQRCNKSFIYLMIFNLSLIEKKIDLINRKQKFFHFNSAREIVSHHIKQYRKPKESKNILESQARNIIQGIIFGFPLANVIIFSEELATDSLRAYRKVYVVKNSPSLVFIGYKNTKAQSQATIKRWLRALQKTQKL